MSKGRPIHFIVTSRSRDPLEYKWRARQALNSCERKMALDRQDCLAAIAANDAEDAGRYASRLGHEAGYHEWVMAKLRGRPFVARMSSRPPKDITDYTRNTPAYK